MVAQASVSERLSLIEDRFSDSALGAILGVLFTIGIFSGIAYFQRSHVSDAPAEVEDLRAVTIPMDPPPPKITEEPVPVEEALPFAGLDIGASDSPVKIAVVPPDLQVLMPSSDLPPAAVIPVAQLYTNFKPKMDVSADFNRIFQQAEVDQKPAVLARPDPVVPPSVRGDAKTLRVLTLVLVDKKGAVADVRIIKSSGNQGFDTLITQSIRQEWLFSPAVRRGRNVRCLVEQTVTVVWGSGNSPFLIR